MLVNINNWFSRKKIKTQFTVFVYFLLRPVSIYQCDIKQLSKSLEVNNQLCQVCTSLLTISTPPPMSTYQEVSPPWLVKAGIIFSFAWAPEIVSSTAFWWFFSYPRGISLHTCAARYSANNSSKHLCISQSYFTLFVQFPSVTGDADMTSTWFLQLRFRFRPINR